MYVYMFIYGIYNHIDFKSCLLGWGVVSIIEITNCSSRGLRLDSHSEIMIIALRIIHN